MNVTRALGFLVVGLVLKQLPHWAPGWCATPGFDGVSTREIWLLLMGWLQISIAAAFLLRAVGTVAGRCLRYEPRPRYEAPRVASMRAWARAHPVRRRVVAAAGDRARRALAAAKPVAFPTPMLGKPQPRAA